MIQNVEERARLIWQIDKYRKRGYDAPTLAGKLKCDIQTIEIIYAELDFRFERGEKPPAGYRYSALTDAVWEVYLDIAQANEDKITDAREKTKLKCAQMANGALLTGEKLRKWQITVNSEGEPKCVLWLPPPSRGAPIQAMDLNDLRQFAEEIKEVARQMTQLRRSMV